MKDYSKVIEVLLPAVQQIFGEHLIQVILYGSVARGTQTDESDMDIAILVDGHNREMHDKLIEIAVDLELEYDVVLSTLLIDYAEFCDWENVLPFYKNMKKEGITLWKAA